MKILIIEDEKPAAKRLTQLIQQQLDEATILDVIDSVSTATQWFKTNAKPDLVFMDIQLADGLSFEIFEQTEVNAPIIFTTAFNEYALQAFKVNSVDYLLKPIEPNLLETALHKYKKYHQSSSVGLDAVTVQQLIQNFSRPSYKERFLIKMGQQLSYLPITEIAYFYSEEGLVFACEKNGKRHNLDYTLDQLNEMLAPQDFFRINRKMIVHLKSILKIHTYFNSRLKLDLLPNTDLETIVSRERVNEFKSWLDK